MNNDSPAGAYSPAKNLVVLGTVNRDHVVFVHHQPLPGETILGTSYKTGTGGKGANQAAAAAHAGASVTFVSAIGDDSAGSEMLADLAEKGVDVSHVTRAPSMPSGVALITVASDGENSIVVAPGASATLDASTVAEIVSSLVGPGSVLLTQLELPVSLVEQACTTAHVAGARIVLNPSPIQEVAASVLGVCNPLIVNAGEASALSGMPCDTVEDARAVALALAGRCVSVVVTLGADGAVAADQNPARHFPAAKVSVVDTTGAGDSFAGALAAALFAGLSLDDAVVEGVAAAAVTVQHVGAQPPRSDRS